MRYRIQFTQRAEKSFIALPKQIRIRIEKALYIFSKAPFHHQDVKKVRGCPPDKPRYRMRIGEYRVTFRIIEGRLIICVVAAGKKENFEY